MTNPLVGPGRALVRDRLSWGLGLVAIPLGAAYLYVNDPSEGGFVPCPFRMATGLDCPGCGTTRALNRLMHADAGAAFGYNPLAMVMLPVVGYALCSSALAAATGRRSRRLHLPAWSGWAIGGVLVAFWVARNIPHPLLAWMGTGS